MSSLSMYGTSPNLCRVLEICSAMATDLGKQCGRAVRGGTVVWTCGSGGRDHRTELFEEGSDVRWPSNWFLSMISRDGSCKGMKNWRIIGSEGRGMKKGRRERGRGMK
jgi:hypothetical protein